MDEDRMWRIGIWIMFALGLYAVALLMVAVIESIVSWL